MTTHQTESRATGPSPQAPYRAREIQARSS
jgi:hypothetical protein